MQVNRPNPCFFMSIDPFLIFLFFFGVLYDMLTVSSAWVASVIPSWLFDLGSLASLGPRQDRIHCMLRPNWVITRLLACCGWPNKGIWGDLALARGDILMGAGVEMIST